MLSDLLFCHPVHIVTHNLIQRTLSHPQAIKNEEKSAAELTAELEAAEKKVRKHLEFVDAAAVAKNDAVITLYFK